MGDCYKFCWIVKLNKRFISGLVVKLWFPEQEGKGLSIENIRFGRLLKSKNINRTYAVNETQTCASQGEKIFTIKPPHNLSHEVMDAYINMLNCCQIDKMKSYNFSHMPPSTSIYIKKCYSTFSNDNLFFVLKKKKKS